MLYYLVRPFARLGILIYFRKIYLANMELLPKNKPVILAANHPTGFMEPCIMAVFMKQPLYYLVRGDFFEKGIFDYLLRSLKMVPIYRIEDAGYRGLRVNYSTFEACYEQFSANQVIMIFPEGSTAHEKRLRPIQKGFARIAFGALERFPEMDELYIVPLGVNYTYAEQFRGEVMIECGSPLLVHDYLDPDNRIRAASDLTKEITQRLESKVVIIRDPADEPLAEHLLVLDRSDRLPRPVWPVLSRDSRPFLAEKAVTERLNSLAAEAKQALFQKTSAYFSKLESMGLEDWALARPSQPGIGITLLLLLGALPALLGWLFGYPPARLATYVKESRVTRVEFFSPVLLATAIGTFLVYYFLWLILAAWTGWWPLIPMVILLGGLSYGSGLYREALARWRAPRRVNALPAEVQDGLGKEREGIGNRE